MHSKYTKLFTSVCVWRVLLSALSLCALSVSVGQAQAMLISEPMVQTFPTIRAEAVFFDQFGRRIDDIVPADLRVIETSVAGDTVDLTSTVQVKCNETLAEPEVSVIIVLDESRSMGDSVNGRSRFDYAKDAIKKFLTGMAFVGQTRVSLIAFSGTCRTVVEWASSSKPIIDSLDKLRVRTNTNYVLPFDQPGSNIYSLFLRSPANISKYVVFLTDGYPNPGIEVAHPPGEAAFVALHSRWLQERQIRFTSITLLEKYTYPALKEFARVSGGRSIVTDEQSISDQMAVLAMELRNRRVCEISWNSPYLCLKGSNKRFALVTLLRNSVPNKYLPYTTPPSGRAGVEISDRVLFCGIGVTSDTPSAIVSIRATSDTAEFTGYSLARSDEFSVVDWDHPSKTLSFAPFRLAPGQTRTLRVQYKWKHNNVASTAYLALNGPLCPQEIKLIGGPYLRLVSPIGGEIYKSCDTIPIRWAGVDPTTPIWVSYSNDWGQTWNSMAPRATGLEYDWTVPGPGKTYMVRVDAGYSGANDCSEEVFTIIGPQLQTSRDLITFSAVAVGRSDSTVVMLSNSGNADATLGKMSITGVNADEFSLSEDLINTVVPPDSSRRCSIVFKPKGIGKRTALLNIEADCSQISVQPIVLEGAGTVTSVEHQDATSNSFISANPNPANDAVDLSFHVAEPSLLQLVSPDGRIVTELVVNPSEQRTRIPVSNLPSGIYAARLHNRIGSVSTLVVVVR